MSEPLHIPTPWEAALARAAACRRVAVIGPTDSGKSSFISLLAGRRPDVALLDLDPGQKMIGPPGAATAGFLQPEPRLERFIFLGSTSVGSFSAIASAAAGLAAAAGRPFVANTSGYVIGPGARLQAMTLAALRPHLVVAIGAAPELEPLLARLPPERALGLEASPAARPKTEGERRGIRQRAFDRALEGAAELVLDAAVEPAPPRPFDKAERPVCSLADESGEDMELGLMTHFAGGEMTVLARRPPRPVRSVRIGKLWAAPAEGGWKLLERLVPAWAERG